MDEQQEIIENDLITIQEAAKLFKKSEITIRALINNKKLTIHIEEGMPKKYGKISKSELHKIYPFIIERSKSAGNIEKAIRFESYEFLLEQVKLKDSQISFLQEETRKNSLLEYSIKQFEETINILRDQIGILRDQLQNKDEQMSLIQSNFETSQKRLQVFEKLQFSHGYRIIPNETGNLNRQDIKEEETINILRDQISVLRDQLQNKKETGNQIKQDIKEVE